MMTSRSPLLSADSMTLEVSLVGLGAHRRQATASGERCESKTWTEKL
jgi:hypothetical protein